MDAVLHPTYECQTEMETVTRNIECLQWQMHEQANKEHAGEIII